MASYKAFARWHDAAQLRWDSGHCEIGERYIRFYLRHRKNAQDAENFVDIAKPRCSSEHGAYHILCDARNVFKSGHVLPYISAAGHVDTKRPLPYRKFVQHLRKCLVSVGVPQQEALRFAGQSARAGAATCAARAGVAAHEICRLAGVKSIGWHLGYMRPDFEDRLRASGAVGMCWLLGRRYNGVGQPEGE